MWLLIQQNAWFKWVDYAISLSGFQCTWTTLCAEGQLLLGNTTVSFLLKSPTLFHLPVMSLLNTLIYAWLSSLIKALHPDNADHNNWLYSYHKEKGGLEHLTNASRKKQYLQPQHTNHIGKALPLMCILSIKPGKDGNPSCVKSWIVLGNLKIDATQNSSIMPCHWIKFPPSAV